MTFEKFRYVVWQLSNGCFVRHWRDYYHEDCTRPQTFAICCIDGLGRPEKIYEGDLPAGWISREIGGLTYYFWERTD